MKCISLGSTVRIFYKTNQLTSGQPVIFHIWDDSGSPLVSSGSATEVGTEGVYYYDYIVPTTNLYLLIIGSNNGTSPEAQIIKVGDPDRKAFYVHGSFKTGQEIGYDVYDESAVLQATGLLTDIVSGFYSTDVSAIAEPWFFEVFPWASRNQPCSTPIL